MNPGCFQSALMMGHLSGGFRGADHIHSPQAQVSTEQGYIFSNHLGVGGRSVADQRLRFRDRLRHDRLRHNKSFGPIDVLHDITPEPRRNSQRSSSGWKGRAGQAAHHGREEIIPAERTPAVAVARVLSAPVSRLAAGHTAARPSASSRSSIATSSSESVMPSDRDISRALNRR